MRNQNIVKKEYILKFIAFHFTGQRASDHETDFPGMELDPKYFDVIIDRWEKFAGEKAVNI
jgi:hypothetical protein